MKDLDPQFEEKNHQAKQIQIKKSPRHIIEKGLKIKAKEEILQGARGEKRHLSFKGT